MSGVRSDVGPWAMVPRWVRRAGLSDRAVRLYAELADLADRDTGEAIVRRSVLCEYLGGCSLDSLDRAKAELIAAGALEVEERYRNGDRIANGYVVMFANPQPVENPVDGEGGWPHGCGDPGRVGAATVAAPVRLQESEPSTQNQGGRARKRAVAPPKDYQATVGQQALAVMIGCDVEREVEKWLTWCEAEGRTYKNPTAGFTVWLNRERDRRESTGTARPALAVVPGGPMLPPARAETCPRCDSHVLACTCPKEEAR